MNKKRALEAKIVELEKRFKSLASLDQVIRFHKKFRSRIIFFPKNYIFHISKQMVVETIICVQIIAKNMVPIINKALKSCLANQIIVEILIFMCNCPYQLIL